MGNHRFTICVLSQLKILREAGLNGEGGETRDSFQHSKSISYFDEKSQVYNMHCI